MLDSNVRFGQSVRVSRPSATQHHAWVSELALSARAWIEIVRFMNYWRPHGSPTEAERRARECLQQRGRLLSRNNDEGMEPMGILALLESQTLWRRRRSVEWATTWAAINDVLCIELETLIRQPHDYDPSDLLGILKYARSRRAEFPLDEPGEIAVTAKRESILAA